ncbi:MAG TPA: ABC transporter ATP-binding protein [Bryobacteraceae bacterium]|nr:ABC transporter ATP-binding protein [Bryobacteraceae bacterium]
MIQVTGLSKRYARHVAVNNISFSVEKGDIVGFLGPNGAGKTTTMRILTCFMPPTEGQATVAGFDVFDQAFEVKKHIGYLPETPPLYPEMSVRDYLHFVARLKNIPNSEIKSRAEQVMERCSVADVSSKLISKLSKGYRQRVGLAQAIIHNPDVLILDEPTSGLDPKQINETRELIKSLAGEHTIILSTHILPEVEAVCKNVIIINKGRVVVTDSVDNLKNRAGIGGAIQVQVDTAGNADALAVHQRLEQVSGVSKVLDRDSTGSRFVFEVESLQGQNARADVARAIVHAGWNLLELKSSSLTLEEVFLELTGSTHAAALPPATEPSVIGGVQ